MVSWLAINCINQFRIANEASPIRHHIDTQAYDDIRLSFNFNEYEQSLPLSKGIFGGFLLSSDGNDVKLQFDGNKEKFYDDLQIKYADQGNLVALKEMKEGGIEINSVINFCAAGRGHLDILKWSKENDIDFRHTTTTMSAAMGGHLEVLKWLRENNCPWDESTSEKAAANGHLEVLKWARENGCPWNFDVYKGALRYGHLDILQLAFENGCPLEKGYQLTCSDKPEIKEWVKKHGLSCEYFSLFEIKLRINK